MLTLHALGQVCRRRTEVAQHRARHGGSRLRSWCHELPSTLEWLFIDLGCGYGTQVGWQQHAPSSLLWLAQTALFRNTLTHTRTHLTAMPSCWSQPLRVFKFSAVMVVSFAVLLFVPVMARGPPRDYEDMEVGFVLRSYNLLGLPWWDAALTVRDGAGGGDERGTSPWPLTLPSPHTRRFWCR